MSSSSSGAIGHRLTQRDGVCVNQSSFVVIPHRSWLMLPTEGAIIMSSCHPLSPRTCIIGRDHFPIPVFHNAMILSGDWDGLVIDAIGRDCIIWSIFQLVRCVTGISRRLMSAILFFFSIPYKDTKLEFCPVGASCRWRGGQFVCWSAQCSLLLLRDAVSD